MALSLYTNSVKSANMYVYSLCGCCKFPSNLIKRGSGALAKLQFQLFNTTNLLNNINV